MILKENLEEFKTWYNKQVEKRVYNLADQAVIDYFQGMMDNSPSFNLDDNDNFNSFSFDSLDDYTTKSTPSIQQTAYSQVDKLNEQIFNSSMNSIK